MRTRHSVLACSLVLSASFWSCSDDPSSTVTQDRGGESMQARQGAFETCSVTALEFENEVTAVYNEAECSVTFTWYIDASLSDPCRPEVYWGPYPSSCWAGPPTGLPFHDVGEYTDDGVQSITISVAATGIRRVKFRCLSMSDTGQCGIWFPNDGEVAWCDDIGGIDPMCEPIFPCEEPCN